MVHDHAQLDTVPFTCREHFVCLLDSERKRLLAQDVLPSLGGRDRDFMMQVVREADRYDANRVVGEQFAVIGCDHRCSEATSELDCARLVSISDTD
jgi:hypothetical protein